jgi:hypothetical protein
MWGQEGAVPTAKAEWPLCAESAVRGTEIRARRVRPLGGLTNSPKAGGGEMDDIAATDLGVRLRSQSGLAARRSSIRQCGHVTASTNNPSQALNAVPRGAPINSAMMPRCRKPTRPEPMHSESTP